MSTTFETGGLKNVDINSKVISLQCSWVRQLYYESFHEWKVIPLHLICIILIILISHTMLNYLPVLPIIYKNILNTGANIFTVSPELPSCILSTFLRYNKNILITNKPMYFKYFSNGNLNYVTQLFCDTRNTKYGLTTNSIWTIISMFTGWNLFTQYLKNGKTLKIIEYLKTLFFESPFDKMYYFT